MYGSYGRKLGQQKEMNLLIYTELTEQTVLNIYRFQLRTFLHDRQKHEQNLAVSEEDGGGGGGKLYVEKLNVFWGRFFLSKLKKRTIDRQHFIKKK